MLHQWHIATVGRNAGIRKRARAIARKPRQLWQSRYGIYKIQPHALMTTYRLNRGSRTEFDVGGPRRGWTSKYNGNPTLLGRSIAEPAFGSAEDNRR
jgi:hypothetical protein